MKIHNKNLNSIRSLHFYIQLGIATKNKINFIVRR